MPFSVVPVVGVDHAPTTAFATETPSRPSISVPVSDSEPLPARKQLGSASGRGLESSPTVSDHAVLMIVFANYWFI